MTIILQTEYLGAQNAPDVVTFFHDQGEATINLWPVSRPITLALLQRFLCQIHRRQIIVVARNRGAIVGILIYSRPSTLLDADRWPFSIDQIMIDDALSAQDAQAVDTVLTATTIMFRHHPAAV